MKNKMLEWALFYYTLGIHVFPLSGKVPPKGFNLEACYRNGVTEEQIREWWEKQYRKANIGIICGKLSGITVIDLDLYKCESSNRKVEFVRQLSLADDVPVSRTARGGKHLFFAYNPSIPSRSRILEKYPWVDAKNDGGYIVAPPSITKDGKYTWENKKILKSSLRKHTIPRVILDNINNNLLSNNTIYCKKHANKSQNDNKRQRLTTNDNVIPEGRRDEVLFHIANHLAKGKMPVEEIEEILTLIATKGCEPPFPLRQAKQKVASAIKRLEKRTRPWLEEIRQMILATSGNITTTTVHQWQQATTREEKKIVNECLRRLEKEGLLRRTGRRAGEYRITDHNIETMDLRSCEVTSIPLQLPFNAHKYFYVRPKNVIVYAGVPDSGKSAIAFNIIRMNMNNPKLPPIHYFSSEMGPEEIKSRLENFEDIPFEDWNFTAYERSEKFADVIRPNDINIIDYIEEHDEFYRMGGRIASIWQALKTGVAIIFIQKAPKADVGRGGVGTLEKPRAYFTVDKAWPDHKITIQKMKNWTDPKRNPNGLSLRFKIVGGCKLIETSSWERF